MTREALKALIHEMEYVLSCINAEEIPFDGDDFHEALRLGKEALDYLAKEKALQALHNENERLGLYKDAYAQTEQEPVAWRTFDGEGGYDYRSYEDNESYADEWDKRNPNHKGWVDKLYTAAPQRPRVVFPTMLRKMWSGSEVQAWLDENVDKENT